MAKVKVDGKEYEIGAGESVLAALLRHGLPVPHSCRQGNCMTCMSQLISGQVPARSQNVLLRKQKEMNLFLACVCWPKEDIEILLRKPLSSGQGNNK